MTNIEIESLVQEWTSCMNQFLPNYHRANEIVNELRDKGLRIDHDPNRLGGVIARKR